MHRIIGPRASDCRAADVLYCYHLLRMLFERRDDRQNELRQLEGPFLLPHFGHIAVIIVWQRDMLFDAFRWMKQALNIEIKCILREATNASPRTVDFPSSTYIYILSNRHNVWNMFRTCHWCMLFLCVPTSFAVHYTATKVEQQWFYHTTRPQIFIYWRISRNAVFLIVLIYSAMWATCCDRDMAKCESKHGFRRTIVAHDNLLVV